MSSTNPKRYNELAEKWLNGTLTPEEEKEYNEWYDRTDMGEIRIDPQFAASHGQLKSRIFNRIVKSANARDIPIRTIYLRMASAAAVVAAIVLFVYFYRAGNKPGEQHLAGVEVKNGDFKNDVQPGKNKALLTLSDGRQISLDDSSAGLLASEGAAKIVKSKDGSIAYNGNGKSGEALLNTMVTPRGGEYQLTLPDGTRVWLNAASSIHFPIAFTGNTRSVDITGEAYFEVAQDKRKPFHVKFNAPMGGEGEVEVLGTHFNINSYSDETTANTTLLEGSVRIIHGSTRSMLQPGQQAQLNTTQTIRIINNADIEKIMAWKNGVFDFQDATLEEVMRQLQRWYDIEVAYEKDVPKLEFIGRMGRDLPLSKVLNGLEVSKVHFRLEGRRLIVLP